MKRFNGILGAFAWFEGRQERQRAAEEAMIKDFEQNWTVKDVIIDITTADSNEVETVKGQIMVKKTEITAK
jgi:hypothetical protein